MVDYAQLKEERTAYITALATFMQSAAPLVEMDPKATPILLEMLKWGLAGFKGSNEVEGVLDQAIKAMQGAQGKEQEGEEQPSDAQVKAQMQQAKQDFEKLKTQATQDFEREKWAHEKEMAQIEAQNSQTQVSMEAEKDLQKEAAQYEFNIEEEKNETTEFIKRERARKALTPNKAGQQMV
jgi:hypothetical protein